MAPGLFVNATIQGGTLHNIMIAPRSALRGEDEVYIGNPKEGTLSIRKVDVVYSSDDGAYLSSGVAAGELAVVSPIQAAFDGMRVKILERMPDGTVVSHDPDTSGGEAVADADGDSEGGVQ